MAKESLILLSQRPALYKQVADWHLPATEVYVFEEAASALSRLAARDTAVFLVDTRDLTGAPQVVAKALALPGDTDLVVLGDRDELEAEGDGDALPAGVFRVLPPDVPADELQQVVATLLRLRQVRADSGIVGRSRAVDQMIALIAQAAPLDINVLIQGESGTGKELVARAIHHHSTRRQGPFVSLNCGAISEGVLESELFGHARGAFTGAVAEHAGVFERADGGTLFLDEVGEMPLGMQTRFLRALETGEFTPVGGKATRHSDIRLVAATNKDLASEIETGRFRQDLYYRLRVIVIPTPPLRERKEDIILLAERFLAEENREHGLALRGFGRHAKQLLRQHSWPGNVRELRNVVRAAAVMKQRGLIEVEDLPPEVRNTGHRPPSPYLPALVGGPRQGFDLDPALVASTLIELRQDIKEIKDLLLDLREGGASDPGRIPHEGLVVSDLVGGGDHDEGDLQTAERALIRSALRAVGGNRRLAADRLGISERTLYRKIKQYDL